MFQHRQRVNVNREQVTRYLQATSHRQPVTAMAMATAMATVMATAMAVTGCLLLVACIWLLVFG